MAEYLVTRNFFQETAATKANCVFEAMILAEDGDTIILDLGEWNEDVRIDKAVTLCGRGARDETVLRGTVKVTATNVTIRELTLASNGEAETESPTQPVGIHAEKVENLTVADCIIRDWNPGISLKTVKNASVIGCLLQRNSGTGIMLDECENCEVTGNEFTANSWFSLRLRKSSNNRVCGNRFELSGWASIDLFMMSRNNVISENLIYGGNLGMSISSANNVIEKNRIENCNHGIFVADCPFDRVPNGQDQSRPHTDVNLSSNRVIGNDVRNSKREGIVVRRSSGTVIENSVITASQFNGIVIISDNTQKLRDNRISGSVLADVADLSKGYKLAHKRGKVLWGDTHMHTEISDASGSIAEGMMYARDALGLDFVGSADHSESMFTDKKSDRWAMVREACKKFNEPGRFLAVPGFEITYMNTWWGHFNVYYADFDGPLFAAADLALMKLNPEAAPLEKLLEALKRVKGRHIVIRHHFMACPCYWDRTVDDPVVMPGTDICSIHANWERDGDIFRNAPWTHPITTVRQGLKRGFRFAVMAGSDTHYALPGDYALTAILTDDFTIDGIFDAIIARRTYATTGEKIDIEFTVDGYEIGSSYVPDGAPTIRARVKGTGELEQVQIVRDNCVLYSHPGGQISAEIEFEDRDWVGASFYYLRVVQRDGGQAWTTPVWVDGKK